MRQLSGFEYVFFFSEIYFHSAKKCEFISHRDVVFCGEEALNDRLHKPFLAYQTGERAGTANQFFFFFFNEQQTRTQTAYE